MGSPRVNYKTDNSGTAYSQEYLVESAAKLASRNLLVAQLRYGQHGLQETAFWDTVRELRVEGYL